MSQAGTPDLPLGAAADERSGVGSQAGQQQKQASFFDSKPPQSESGSTNAGKSKAGEGEGENEEEIKKKEAELAIRLASLIEGANNQVVPVTKMIRRNIEAMFERKEEDRDEDELVQQVKPLLEQAEKILNETNGAIKGADPDNELTDKAKRNMADHKATPEEQRLAEALKVLIEEVGGTIEWAKDKLSSFPKAKKDLGPLLDALGQPLTQIVGGVGMLLYGVLNLVNNLLSGLGLDGLLKGIVAATGLDKIYKGLGLDKWLNPTK